MAAEVLTGGLVGSLVDKLLSRVLQAASLARQHNKNYEELYTLVSRIQPLASVCSKANAEGPATAAMHNWLQSLHKVLKEAEKILQASCSTRSPKNVIKKISNSKEILRVTRSIKGLVDEAGLVGLSYNLQKQSSLEQYVHSLELSLSKRTAFHSPTWNYGHDVGITTPHRASLSQIRQSADAFSSMNSIAGVSTTTPREATNHRPKNSEIEYRRYHNERSTWSHFLDVGSEDEDEEIEEEGGNQLENQGGSDEEEGDEEGGDEEGYLKAMARYTLDDEDEEIEEDQLENQGESDEEGDDEDEDDEEDED